MDQRFHDLRQLAELLEAEAAGLPVDRRRAHRLASTLAEHHPDIGRSLRMICDRMQGQSQG